MTRLWSYHRYPRQSDAD